MRARTRRRAKRPQKNADHRFRYELMDNGHELVLLSNRMTSYLHFQFNDLEKAPRKDPLYNFFLSRTLENFSISIFNCHNNFLVLTWLSGDAKMNLDI